MVMKAETAEAKEKVLVECPQCRARLRAPASALGRKLSCPRCKTAFPAVELGGPSVVDARPAPAAGAAGKPAASPPASSAGDSGGPPSPPDVGGSSAVGLSTQGRGASAERSKIGSLSSVRTKPDPRLGTKLGQFRLIELLGRGGMGAVYEAEDEHLQRRVAVKVLPPEMIGRDEEAVERFLREARLAARLEHPNIVTVYQVGSEGDTRYIAMQLVKGGSAADFLTKHGPMAVPDATRVVMEAARALAAAHAAGIIHRDIKPANIMLGPSWMIKVADFGLAKLDSGEVTSPGNVMGTPSYVSPEAAQGLAVDTRTDLYSLGATYFCLLTGRPPFRGENSPSILFQHVSTPAPDPRQFRADVPPAVAAVVLKSLEKDPSARFQTADEMVSALEAVLTDPELGYEFNVESMGGSMTFPAGGIPGGGGGTAGAKAAAGRLPDPRAVDPRSGSGRTQKFPASARGGPAGGLPVPMPVLVAGAVGFGVLMAVILWMLKAPSPPEPRYEMPAPSTADSSKNDGKGEGKGGDETDHAVARVEPPPAHPTPQPPSHTAPQPQPKTQPIPPTQPPPPHPDPAEEKAPAPALTWQRLVTGEGAKSFLMDPDGFARVTENEEVTAKLFRMFGGFRTGRGFLTVDAQPGNALKPGARVDFIPRLPPSGYEIRFRLEWQNTAKDGEAGLTYGLHPLRRVDRDMEKGEKPEKGERPGKVDLLRWGGFRFSAGPDGWRWVPLIDPSETRQGLWAKPQTAAKGSVEVRIFVGHDGHEVYVRPEGVDTFTRIVSAPGVREPGTTMLFASGGTFTVRDLRLKVEPPAETRPLIPRPKKEK